MIDNLFVSNKHNNVEKVVNSSFVVWNFYLGTPGVLVISHPISLAKLQKDNTILGRMGVYPGSCCWFLTLLSLVFSELSKIKTKRTNSFLSYECYLVMCHLGCPQNNRTS